MSCYLLIGCFWYGVVALIRCDTFIGASKAGIARGVVLGVLLWPLLVVTFFAWLILVDDE